MPANVWLMDGIVVPASVARAANFFATKGENGILLPTDLRCTALPTPGAAVRFAPGTASMVNTFATAGGGQSYITNLEVSEDLAIPATGSGSGATRRVWQRINDPQYSGSTYNATFGYGSAWPTGFPYVKIATINQPASTATITQAMIVNERQMAVPRSTTEMRTLALSGATVETLSTTTAYPAGGQTWPVATETAWGDIYIPTWATRCKIIMTWSGIRVPAGNAFGALWVQVAPTVNPDNFKTQSIRYDSTGATNISRMMHRVPDLQYIPAALRGTSQKFYPRGNVDAGVASGARWQLDAGSGMDLQIEFMEVPD